MSFVCSVLMSLYCTIARLNSVSLNLFQLQLAHGITQYASGLEYRDMSGGLNEAFSDITGEVAEQFVKGDNDWMVSTPCAAIIDGHDS